VYDVVFSDQTAAALRLRAAAPPPPPRPPGLTDGLLGAALGAIPAGGMQALDSLSRISTTDPSLDLRLRADQGRLPRLDSSAEQQRTRVAEVTAIDRSLPEPVPGQRDAEPGSWWGLLPSPDVARWRGWLTPDPTTTGKAAMIVHQFGSFATQAAVAGAAFGPVGGAVAAGTLAGEQQSARLQAQGVDPSVAREAGMLSGVITAATLPIPLAGRNWRQTLGLIAAGGPGAFMAEQQGIRTILQRADYADIAAQYDPLDLTGLLLSTLPPAAFAAGVHGARAGRSAAEARADAVLARDASTRDGGASANARLPSAPDAAVDAARTMVMRRQIDDTAPVRDPSNPDAQMAHQRALDEAEAQLARGEPVSPRSAVVDPDVSARVESRVADAIAAEVRALDSAYTRVLDNPVGAADDPLVRLTSDRIGEVIVERGPVWERGEADVEVGGYGLVKIIWKHGERSGKEPDEQVTRADVLRLPEVIRDFEPVTDRAQGDGKRLLEWQIERADGKRVIYSVRGFVEDGRQHVVTVFVNEGRTPDFKNKPLSQKVGTLPGSSSGGSKPRPAAAGTRDTGRESFSIVPRGGQAGATDSSVPRTAGDATADPVRQAAAERPEAEVALFTDQEGKAVPLTAREALEQADAEFAQAQADTRAFDAAIACAIRTGDLE